MGDYENDAECQRCAIEAKLEEVEFQIEELERRREGLQDELYELEMADFAV
jgi:hypothetical protein